MSNNVFGAFLFSIAASFASAAAIVGVSSLGVSHNEDARQEARQELLSKGPLTSEQFESLQREYAEKRAKDQNAHAAEATQMHSREVMKESLYYIWVPWLIIPLVYKLRDWKYFGAFLSLPVLGVVFGVLGPIELSIIVGSVFLGVVASRILRIRKQP